MSQNIKAPQQRNGTAIPRYYTGIDGLRAIAILLVLFHHYWYQPVAYGLQLGNMGVDLFFVISGFLITGIVLSYRAMPLGEALKTFYIRRTLRIFPLYYLYIAIAAVIFWNVATSKELIYSALYAYNFFVIGGNAGALPLGHFWSLAVEEQFYIVWPILMLTLPVRFIRPFIVLSILLGFAFAVYCVLAPIPFGAYMHPVSCMEALAMGGLLAHLQRNSAPDTGILSTVSKWSPLLLVISFAAWATVLKFQWYYPVLYPMMRTCNALIAFVLLTRVIRPASVPTRFDRLFSAIMMNPVLRFIGRISYGIYVYHFLVKYLLDPQMERLLGTEKAYLVTVPLYTLITIGISYISFRFIESPVNKLKDRFQAKVPVEVAEHKTPV